jgi:hypothetical protein
MIAQVISNGIILFGFIDSEECSRVTHCAKLPTQDWTGMTLYVLDWRIEGDRVRLTYRTREEVCAPIFYVWLPVVRNSTPLQKPSKSKYWELCEYEDSWKNTRTGNKVSLLVLPNNDSRTVMTEEHKVCFKG